MENKPRVSVTIATYNSEETVLRALESIAKQTYSWEMIELTVIDDGSTDGTFGIVRDYLKEISKTSSETESPSKLIRQKQRGTAVAHTKGIKKCTGKYIFVLSHDCGAAPDWIETTVKLFETDPNLGIIQGQVLSARNGAAIKSLAFNNRVATPIVHCTTFERFNWHFPTVAIAYRAEALDKAGRYYRRDLSRYGDDSDLAYRILRTGYTNLFIDHPTAYHEVLPEPFWKEIRNAWGCYRFPLIFKKNPEARRFLKRGFLWGGKDRYLRMLFWPFFFLQALVLVFLDRGAGLKSLHQILWDTVFTASLFYGSLRYRSVVL